MSCDVGCSSLTAGACSSNFNTTVYSIWQYAKRLMSEKLNFKWALLPGVRSHCYGNRVKADFYVQA